MSVTLFRCPKCDVYSTSATVSLHVSAILDPQRGMLRVGGDASLPEGYSIPLESVVESLCLECEGPAELVVLDECLHQWQAFYGYPCGRRCMFCNEQQEGHVVYDV